MNDHTAVIGIDIGGTKISAALFDLHGVVLEKEIRQVSERRGDEVTILVGDLIRHLVAEAGKAIGQIGAIGICVPGIYHPTERTVWAPNIPDWDHYPLWDELRRLLGDPTPGLVIESDRSCYILGEVWKGCAQGCDDAIFMAVGTGIGAGILSNGRIITGNGGIAGAIGWMALDPPYDRKYDRWGNFEYYASGDGIARSAIEVMKRPHRKASCLDRIPPKTITAHHILDAFEKEDPVGTEVLNKAIRYWGMAVANLVSIFNPEKVIFGGGVFGPATKLLDKILVESKKWAQPLAIQKVTLESSALKGDAGLIGAGYSAIRSIDHTDD